MRGFLSKTRRGGKSAKKTPQKKNNGIVPLKLMMTRDMQNANSLVNSQMNLNKYSWEEDGEKILNTNSNYFSSEMKRILKLLLLKKMPHEYRPKLWLLTSGAKKEMSDYPDYYKNLTLNFPANIPSPYLEQIEMDLRRTFPSDEFFNDENNLNSLKNILLAYSRRNISIGYCQGFNFIVGMLLKVMKNEEETFWIFVQIVENILPLNYFSNMAGIMVDCAILTNLLQLLIPDLHKYLMGIGYETHINNLLFKWLASLYSNYLSEKLLLILWDVLFLEGSLSLFKVAIGILKLFKKDIMKLSSFEQIQPILEKEATNFDSSHMVYHLLLRRFEINDEYLNKNRNIYEDNIIESFFKSNQVKINEEKTKFLEESKHRKINKKEIRKNSYFSCFDCLLEWQLCIYDIYYKHDITNYFLYKTFFEPVIIEDYFFNIANRDDKFSYNNIERLLDSTNGFKLNTPNKSFENSLFVNVQKEDFSSDKKVSCLKRNINYKSNKKVSFTSIKLDTNIITEFIRKDSENEHEFSLASEDSIKKVSSNSNQDLEELLCRSYDMENVEQYTSDELKKLKVFKSILIERRPHYCKLLSKENFTNINNFNEDNKCSTANMKKINYHKTKVKRDASVKSFTALHPYFNKFFKNEDTLLNKSINFSNFISDLRKTISNKDIECLNVLFDNKDSVEEDKNDEVYYLDTHLNMSNISQ